MTEKLGHNRTRVGGIDASQLRSVIERIEKLTEERAAIGADIREVYAEAHGNGLCKKSIRQIIKLRAKDAAEREEEETVLETYLLALGMRPQLDLGLDEGDAA